MAEFEFSNATGEVFTKLPGTINGESVVLKNLTDCSVYLLDYSGEVEVSNVVNSQIFIGPVDGPAMFDNVKQCQISVASQQFQARNSSDTEYALYCATKPTIEHSHNLRFTCWMGAYPGLTEHFHKANLDPKVNQWDKVHDVSPEEGEGTNFELLDAIEYWEVPIEGGPPPDNPVPAGDGSLYSAPAAAAAGAPAHPEVAAAAAAPADLFTENGGSFPAENGHTGPADFGGEHPKVAAVRAAAQERLRKQESEEAKAKDSLVKNAAGYLENFYQKRNSVKGKRVQENRSAEKQVTVAGPEGDTTWEKTISLINFGFARPNGTDLSRFKSALFAAKARNVPVSTKPAPAKA
ncbi:probable protein XRP2 at N-terminal half [Coccomyxa sp. Obi]|nr:probable protein XRP2 at N-terminal half [Coccomyxa sp. Obi]